MRLSYIENYTFESRIGWCISRKCIDGKVSGLDDPSMFLSIDYVNSTIIVTTWLQYSSEFNPPYDLGERPLKAYI